MPPEHPVMCQVTSGDKACFDHIKSEMFIERDILFGMRFQIDVLTRFVQIVKEGNKHTFGNALKLLLLPHDKIEKIPAVVAGMALFYLLAKTLIPRLRI